MVKELYQIHSREISLSVTNGEIDSVRKKDITRSGCRVYENGCIGVAGTLGQPTAETWQAAQEALSLKIACPMGPTANLQRTRSHGTMPQEAEFIAWAENILATLKAEFPRFILSNKINAKYDATLLENDLGLHLEDCWCGIEVALVVKDETSPNAFDSFVDLILDELDAEPVLNAARQTLSAHANLISMPQEALPVILPLHNIGGALSQALNGSNLQQGASLFSGKVGEKLFDGKFTFAMDRTAGSYADFFDAEGTTLPGDSLPLIKDGVLLRGTADKQTADEHGMELTASAAAAYDDVPQLGAAGMDVMPTGTLADILNGSDAIYIHTSSGGDTTPAGDYATPVQTAYLVQNGRLTARLPEFNFSGSLFHLLGEGYLGCPSDKFLGSESTMLVLRGTIR